MKPRLLPLLLATLGLSVLAGFWMPRDDVFFAIKKNFTIFGKLYEELSANYVDPVDPERMMRAGIDAMLQTLDPYTVFIDEAENQDIDIMMRGRYGGVGLSISDREGKITVIMPIEGYSGFLQGVRAGDVITHIDRKPVENLSSADVSQLLRGDPGTPVELRVEREGEPEPLDFVLMRSEVKLKNVSYSGLADGGDGKRIGYIRLSGFAREAGPEVREAVQQLQAGGGLDGLVLDLRNNPGGLLDAAVEITEQFVSQGSVIVSTRGRTAQMERVYRSKAAPLLPDVPLVVLVNGNSASASEIVAGAVQDLDRGVVLGEKTFGKGLVQIIRPLPYNTSLKLTTSKYYTPSGRCIQAVEYTHQAADGYAVQVADSLRRSFRTTRGRTVRDGGGIEPDLEVGLTEPSDLETALLRRSAFFLFANHYAATHPAVDASFQPSDEVLQAFRAWLRQQNFTYRTDAERVIASLEEDLQQAGYTATSDEVEALRAEVLVEKEADFERQADRLREHLRAEIVARSLGESAQIRASLATDEQYARAVALLGDQAAYEAMLR